MRRCVVLGALLLVLAGCGGAVPAVPPAPEATAEPAPTPTSGPPIVIDAAGTLNIDRGPNVPTELLPDEVHVEELAGAGADLDFPVALAFLPDGRFLVTEKGREKLNDSVVYLFSADGRRQEQPFVKLTVDSRWERGILGIAVDPDFAHNHAIYIFYTVPGTLPVNTVARYVERDGVGQDPKVLFRVPVPLGKPNHNGGNVHFGPDGKLYISIGENAQPVLSRHPQLLHGKMHRINTDGSVPADGPFAPASAMAYGLRNSFDFSFDPRTGNLWATENGPHCDDEVNLISAGKDYGWGPDYSCGASAPGSVPPRLRWRETDGLTGIVFYEGDAIPTWKGSLLICSYKRGALYRARLSPARDAVESITRVALPKDVLCKTDVEVDDSGAVYLLGSPTIYRLS